MFSGEEAVVEQHIVLLKKYGHEVIEFRRSSEELKGVYGQTKGLLSGIYNHFSIRKFVSFLNENKPDIIHIHNLYPLITPWILLEAKKRKIPIVMTVHNFRLICPNGLLYHHKNVCEECAQKTNWQCLKNNCLNSWAKSLGYACRNYIAKKFRLYQDNVNVFLCLSEFQMKKLTKYGISKDRCVVLPNFISNDWLAANTIRHCTANKKQLGSYIAYAGRLSHEKGIDLILEAAKQLPEIKFKLAGSGKEAYEDEASSNVEFVGYLEKSDLVKFYKNARIQLMASRCYEGFPTSLLYGMSFGVPSIVPNHGAMPEIIKECGITFSTASIDDLVRSIKRLWNNVELCSSFKELAKKRCLTKYSEDTFYIELEKVYSNLLI